MWQREPACSRQLQGASLGPRGKVLGRQIQLSSRDSSPSYQCPFTVKGGVCVCLLQKQLLVTARAAQGVRAGMGPDSMTSEVPCSLGHSDFLLWEWFHSGWQA